MKEEVPSKKYAIGVGDVASSFNQNATPGPNSCGSTKQQMNTEKTPTKKPVKGAVNLESKQPAAFESNMSVIYSQEVLPKVRLLSYGPCDWSALTCLQSREISYGKPLLHLFTSGKNLSKCSSELLDQKCINSYD
jgi:hypothetical protein